MAGAVQTAVAQLISWMGAWAKVPRGEIPVWPSFLNTTREAAAGSLQSLNPLTVNDVHGPVALRAHAHRAAPGMSPMR